ncbi:MAG: amino acid ABC transporter substrate-binding protein [Clostridia bacterium]|nr:amino acid ABC transporter substrate-binding protein [Clostridia bacterium]
MKKALVIMLAAVMALSMLIGCGSKSAERTSLTVGFDATFPPYGYVGDDGEYTGFDLEMAAEVCKRLGWELKLQAIDWDAKDAELDSGTIDCIWNGFTINGREDLYTWSDAYMDNSQVFMVKKSSGITTFDDLAGKIVEVQVDTAALSALQGEDYKDLTGSFKELRTCANFEIAFMDLDAGAVDAVAIDIGVAKFQMAGREAEFEILAEALMPEQYGIGFKLGNTELRDTVQATLMEMVNDGTFAKISEKWFGYDVCILGK